MIAFLDQALEKYRRPEREFGATDVRYPAVAGE
jgi:hypothetical protein